MILAYLKQKSPQKESFIFYNKVANYKEATCFVNLDFKFEALLA